MCGVCGYISKNHLDVSVITNMVNSMHHRGPDDSGTEINEIRSGHQLAFGQARLSIIDLTASGHQPMSYRHLTIVFNGEIYNYNEIKDLLIASGHKFGSESDTEVILHAFDEWGLDCVNQFIGMFAFVIYNEKDNKLYCCRDRAGVKPFYYYIHSGNFIFGSELKAFHKHPGFRKEINNHAVSLYFKYRYIPAPDSIFCNTFKLMPGSWLIYDIENEQYHPSTYWDIVKTYTQPLLNINYQDAKSELNKILNSACNYRMVADVPVGIFLSGGYDSTLVTSILQGGSTSRLKTFTIGFGEGNNEAPFAKETAKILGTDHTEYYCSDKEALEIIPSLPYYYDEPFADSSAIPTTLVSQIARKDVTVALSADAGDEIFIGYYRYRSLSRHLAKLKVVPDSMKYLLSNTLFVLNRFIPSKQYFLKHEISAFAETLKAEQKKGIADLLDSIERVPDFLLNKLLLHHSSSDTSSAFKCDLSAVCVPFSSALAYDYQMYLQNDILTKVDRATMSVSLEGREPLLDHRIVEFAAQLPMNYKFDGITTKKILKDIVHDYIPKEKMERPKTGFSIPITKWLKYELSDLLTDTLKWQEMAQQGIFDIHFLKNLITDFKKGVFYDEDVIWRILQFQMWYNKWMK